MWEREKAVVRYLRARSLRVHAEQLQMETGARSAKDAAWVECEQVWQSARSKRIAIEEARVVHSKLVWALGVFEAEQESTAARLHMELASGAPLAVAFENVGLACGCSSPSCLLPHAVQVNVSLAV